MNKMKWVMVAGVSGCLKEMLCTTLTLYMMSWKKDNLAILQRSLKVKDFIIAVPLLFIYLFIYLNAL